MTKFAFVGMDSNGKEIEGIVESESKETLIQEFAEHGASLSRINELTAIEREEDPDAHENEVWAKEDPDAQENDIEFKEHSFTVVPAIAGMIKFVGLVVVVVGLVVGGIGAILAILAGDNGIIMVVAGAGGVLIACVGIAIIAIAEFLLLGFAIERNTRMAAETLVLLNKKIQRD